MKNFRMIIFLCGMIVFTSFSCKKESSMSNTNHLGIPFLIKANGTESLSPILSDNTSSDSSLTISFEKVIYDSRCPKASCYLCYGSSAKIQVLLTRQNEKSTINLTILGCQDEYECDDHLYYRKDTLGYRICFLRLDPYPTGELIDPKNYTAKLNISKL